MVGDVVVSDWLVIAADVTTTGVSEAEAASNTACDVEEDVTSTTLVAISEVVSEDVWPTVVNPMPEHLKLQRWLLVVLF